MRAKTTLSTFKIVVSALAIGIAMIDESLSLLMVGKDSEQKKENTQ